MKKFEDHYIGLPKIPTGDVINHRRNIHITLCKSNWSSSSSSSFFQLIKCFGVDGGEVKTFQKQISNIIISQISPTNVQIRNFTQHKILYNSNYL